MTIENTENNVENLSTETEEQEENRRKRLLLLLLLLLLLVCCVGGLFVKYINKPVPLPDLLPGPIGENINYPPHYLFSIYGVDKPVGMAISPGGDRVYVAESGGERTIKVFDREGTLLDDFTPPGTTPYERSPVYLAVDVQGRIFVADRLQNAIFIYDADGNYIDSILSPNMTLSKYLDQHLGGQMPDGTTFYYNTFKGVVNLTQPGEEEQALPPPDLVSWDPLGVRFDNDGNLLVTVATDHSVRTFSLDTLRPSTLVDFGGQEKAFGSFGQDARQLNFPNVAVNDSRGRVTVSDGNNGRMSMWDAQGNFLRIFGRGTGDESLSLPRGAWVDDKDQLHVVDAVGHTVRVYDISGDEPIFLYTFGELGDADGLFYYPSDICIDENGFLFIADRENNRVQVWSY